MRRMDDIALINSICFDLGGILVLKIMLEVKCESQSRPFQGEKCFSHTFGTNFAEPNILNKIYRI